MSHRRLGRIPASEFSATYLLMQVWREAAEKWQRLRSDPTYVACVVARANWYRHVYGAVPPLPPREETFA